MTNPEGRSSKECRNPNDDELALMAASSFACHAEAQRRLEHSGFLRHSSFVLRHFLLGEIILTHSTTVPRSFSSPADYRSVFPLPREAEDRKSTRLNSSHQII